MSERIEFTTPVGRIVAGDLWTPRTTDHQGQPLTVKTGPNAGQARQEYYIGLAIPKNAPEFQALYAAMVAAGRQGFPSLFDAQGNCLRQDFAFKLIDGDSTIKNKANTRPCDKEGYPGHWVLNLATSISPKCYDRDVKQISPDSKAIKRGDYVRVHLSIAPNGNAQNPGIYVNPSMVQFSHAGEEIFSGPDAGAVFGAAPMSAAPVGAVATPMPALAGMPTGTVAPVPTAPVPPVPTAVTPAPDFLNPPPPAPVVEKFSVNGQHYTRDQLLASGWQSAQIDALPRA